MAHRDCKPEAKPARPFIDLGAPLPWAGKGGEEPPEPARARQSRARARAQASGGEGLTLRPSRAQLERWHELDPEHNPPPPPPRLPAWAFWVLATLGIAAVVVLCAAWILFVFLAVI